MRTAVALLGVVGTAAARGIPTASPTASPSGDCRCPDHSAIADVYLNHPSGPPAAPLHEASDPNTGIVHGAPWTWIPQDGVKLQPFGEESKTLRCGNYYGYECRRVENGTVFKVNCKTGTCDVYVFIYHEPPRSSNTNGRLPQTLPPDWEAGSCAPSFCIEPPELARSRKGQAQQILPTASPTASPRSNLCCRMTAFRRQVDGPGMVNFTIDELFGTMDAYYLLLAVAPGERCDSNARSQGQEPCEAQSDCANALCRWEAGAAAEGKDSHPLVRSAKGLQILPTASPTGSPSAGRCVPNWCPRVPRDLAPAPPVCDAPLTEPACPAPPAPGTTEAPTVPTGYPSTLYPTGYPTQPPGFPSDSPRTCANGVTIQMVPVTQCDFLCQGKPTGVSCNDYTDCAAPVSTWFTYQGVKYCELDDDNDCGHEPDHCSGTFDLFSLVSTAAPEPTSSPTHYPTNHPASLESPRTCDNGITIELVPVPLCDHLCQDKPTGVSCNDYTDCAAPTNTWFTYQGVKYCEWDPDNNCGHEPDHCSGQFDLFRLVETGPR